METKTETNANANLNPQEKKPSVLLVVIVIILAIATVVLGYKYYTESQALTATSEEKAILEDVKSDLEKQLRDMIVEYDSLKTNNDSINDLLIQEQEKITRLLRMQASDAEKIRKYQAELETLRQVMRSYIVQIDSLNTRNKILVAENTQIRQQINRVEQTNVELSKEREELSSKVEIASVIKAKDIIPQPLNKKRKETDRISRMQNLMVCFTLRENPIASAGKKTVYMRVVRPDGLVVTTSPDNLFEAGEDTIIYTESRTVDYLNQDVEMCIYVDNNGDFIEGTYNVFLYLEGVEIGTGSFILTGR